MKKSILVIGSVFFCMPAFAGNHGQQKNSSNQFQGQLQSQETYVSSGAVSSSYVSSEAVGEASADNSVAVDASDRSSTNVRYKEAANSAIAGPLVTSNNTCMGSTTAGGQGLSFGFSLGSTWVDQDCVRRLDAAFLAKIGAGGAAKELMCQKQEIRAAYAAAGKPCQYNPHVFDYQVTAKPGKVDPEKLY